MKPLFEKIHYPEGASWRFFLRELDDLPFEWHYHPEYELTLTLNSQGERYVGDHIATYTQADLVMVGPNLPHSWASTQRPNPRQPHRVYVLWFPQQWVDHLSTHFPEFGHWGNFVDQSRRGLCWPADVAAALTPLFTQLPDASYCERFVLLLQILDHLQRSPTEHLASASFHSLSAQASDQRQLSTLLDCLHREFRANLNVPDLARRHHMSTSTLNRFFRRQMNQTLHQYLTQLRLGHACASLIHHDTPVAVVADTSGFGNLSNFNRLFRRHRGMTPRAFRQSFRSRQPGPGFSSQLAGGLDPEATKR